MRRRYGVLPKNGQAVRVKVLKTDERGRLKLSMKAADPVAEAAAQ